MPALAPPATADDLPTERAAPGIELAFRLPVAGWPRAEYSSDFGHDAARLTIAGERVLAAPTRAALEAGASGALPTGEPLRMQLTESGLVLTVAGRRAVREDRVFARPTRSAWIHAFIALFGSAAGFVASAFYLARSSALAGLDPLSAEWARKMGVHTAGWHLLLTFTLFPASVWGQRAGIRAVQAASLVFFFIHAGIALANADMSDRAIAAFNALSGVLFAASVLYGQRAHRDMDPIRALADGRI